MATSAIACSLPSEDRKLAKKVLDKLSKEADTFFDTDLDTDDSRIEALVPVISHYISGINPDKRDEFYDNPDHFIQFLKGMLSPRVDDEGFDNADASYNNWAECFTPIEEFGDIVEEIHPDTGEPLYVNGEQVFVPRMINLGKRGSLNRPKEVQESIDNILKSCNFNPLISKYFVRYVYRKEDSDRGYVLVTVVTGKPERFNKQEETINRLQEIESFTPLDEKNDNFPKNWIGFEITDSDETQTRIVRQNSRIPKGWHKTGRQRINYRGNEITMTSVTTLEGNSGKAFPVMASPIGLLVDSVGRIFFDTEKRKKFYNEDGTIKSDKELQKICMTEYRGMFTPKGLRNLLQDFQELEDHLREKWGDDIKIISRNIRLYGKTKEGQWIYGEPDLIVVDRNGKCHIIDMKTFKMTTTDNYNEPFKNDTYNRKGNFGFQTSHYAGMLSSYGMDVDPETYVVLIDTWYDSHDFGENNKDDDEDVYTVPEKFTIGNKPQEEIEIKQEEGADILISEYIENNEPSRADVLEAREGAENCLYLQPRLHGHFDDEDHEIVSDAEGALQKVADERKDFTLQSLDKQDMDIIEDTFGPQKGVPERSTMIKETIDDLFNNNGLLSEEEINFIADSVAAQVSEAITECAEGKRRLDNFDWIDPDDAEKQEIETGKGLSREEIIHRVGINTIVFHTLDDHWYRTIISPEESKIRTVQQVLEASEDELRKDYFNGELEDDFDFTQPDEEWHGGDYFTRAEAVRGTRRHEKMSWIKAHEEQFLEVLYPKLLEFEKAVVPVKKKSSTDTEAQVPSIPVSSDEDGVDVEGDNEELQRILDDYMDGMMSDAEAWMLGEKHFSPKASLSQDLKRVLGTIMDKHSSFPDWNVGYLSSTFVVNSLHEMLGECETWEEMRRQMQLNRKNPNNEWIDDVLYMLEKPGMENTKKRFFRFFRKDTDKFSICTERNGIVTTQIVNMKSSEDIIRSSTLAEFKNGHVGNITVNKKTFSLVSMENGKLQLNQAYVNVRNDIKQLRTAIDTIYSRARKEYSQGKGQEDVKGEFELVASDNSSFEAIFYNLLEEEGIFDKTVGILRNIGVYVTKDVVQNTFIRNTPAKKQNGLRKVLNFSLQVLKGLEMEQKDFDSIRPTSGKAYPAYQKVFQLISPSIQEHVQSQAYENGRTTYTFNNPSKMGSIVRNLKNMLGDRDKAFKYVQHEFGRYKGWFMSPDGGMWLNDWLEQISEEITQRGNDYEATFQDLDYKIELSYKGTQYRNLGPLGFMLSILHNYFGSEDDRRSSNHTLRWYAMPTMSNKPTSEFIRMRSYVKNGSVEFTAENVVEKVFIKTYLQETNRIVDILYNLLKDSPKNQHYDLTEKELSNIGFSADDINDLKDRIENHSITVDDLVKLSNTDSGAKFHFLYFMNSRMAKKDGFADAVVSRINKLLDEDSEQDSYTPYQLSTDIYKSHTDLNTVREALQEEGEKAVEEELDRMEKLGLFTTKKIKTSRGSTMEILKYHGEFNGLLGDRGKTVESTLENMKEELRKFVWDSIGAGINIVQITGGDLAYYGNSKNYQKRIAMIHSPGLHMEVDPEVSDGFLRTIHISDEKQTKAEFLSIAEGALQEYMDKSNMTAQQKEEYRRTMKVVFSLFQNILVTDGQSFSSPTATRKKLIMQGEWTDEMEKAYKQIKKGNFNIDNLGVLIQPSKPFVTANVAKVSDSPTMVLRKVPLQDKNSEYTLLLAAALAESTGKPSKMTAIFNFMEKTAELHPRQGIDTVHFASVGKISLRGVISLPSDAEIQSGEYSIEDVEQILMDAVNKKADSNNTERVLSSDEDLSFFSEENGLTFEETVYDNDYVDTIPVSDYIVQQETPAHFLDHEQLYGSQSRILGLSDITPGTKFDVNGEEMSDKEIVSELKNLHAENIKESLDGLMEELHLKDNDEDLDNMPISQRNRILRELEFLLRKELFSDARYGYDLVRACQLVRIDKEGRLDFRVPLMDPIQSRRIQTLLNSIIKKRINKQRINGGPLVQTTAYDNDLHIRFKKKGRGLLPLKETWLRKNPKKTEDDYDEYVKKNQDGIAYYEAYMPIPNAALERLMIRRDGSMMSFEELFGTEDEDGNIIKEGIIPAKAAESLRRCIGYRIPTEDKYSMIPIRIKGFMPKATGEAIMLPKEVTAITGSDFDIDKLYTLLKSFKLNMFYDDDREISDKEITEILNKLDPHGSLVSSIPAVEKNDKHKGKTSDEVAQDEIRRLIRNARKIFNGDRHTMLNQGIYTTTKSKIDLMERFRAYLLHTMFSEYSDRESTKHKEAKLVRNNRILDLQWAILTNKDTVVKMLNPGNFKEQENIALVINILKAQEHMEGFPKNHGKKWTYQSLLAELNKPKGAEKLSAMLDKIDNYCPILPSSKIYYQQQNMQGSQMVGIFANHNVSHAFCSFQKIGIDLNRADGSFYFAGKEIGSTEDGKIIVLDPQKGFNGQLISKSIASFLAASVDTAKNPVLKDMGINTFTGSIAMVLTRIGFSTPEIGLFLAQPIVIDLCDEIMRQKNEYYQDTDTIIKRFAEELGMDNEDLHDVSVLDRNTLTIENLSEHLNDDNYSNEAFDDENDYQKRVLIALNQLHRITKDIDNLTFMTKFNSVKNAAGPTIADTELLKEKVNRFMDAEENETSIFYSGDTEFTDPSEVVKNDPILNAFYEATIGENGAVNKILRNFFPSYFKGFANVLECLKENYLKAGSSLTTSEYNKLVNEYVYFLLTYNDENHKAVIPADYDSLDYLISGLVNRFDKLVKRPIMKLGTREAIPGEGEPRMRNLILDQGLGRPCLFKREADSYIATDILEFFSGKLDPAEQGRIAEAWGSLIHSSDKDMQDFGIDLFFYNLLRTGFGFNNKAMMHLASVTVKENATFGNKYTNYIEGLRQLKNLDLELSNPEKSYLCDRFLEQFIRNHSSWRKIIPNIQKNEIHDGEIDPEFVHITLDREDPLYYRVMKNSHTKEVARYLSITENANGQNMQFLYKLKSTSKDIIMDTEGSLHLTYVPIEPLGISKNFLEYDANHDREHSFFDEVRKRSLLGQDYNEEELENAGTYSSGAWNHISRLLTALDIDRKTQKVIRSVYYGTSTKNTDIRTKLRDSLTELLNMPSLDKNTDYIKEDIEEVIKDLC